MFIPLPESSNLLQPMVTDLLDNTIAYAHNYWCNLPLLNMPFRSHLPCNNFQVPWIWTYLHHIFSSTWLTCQCSSHYKSINTPTFLQTHLSNLDTLLHLKLCIRTTLRKSDQDDQVSLHRLPPGPFTMEFTKPFIDFITCNPWTHYHGIPEKSASLA